MKNSIVRILDMSWRVVVVAAGYTLSLVLGGVALGMLGLLPANANQGVEAAGIFGWMFVGSLIMAVTLGLAARHVPASKARHVLIWSILLLANFGSVVIEGYFFVPELVANVWAALAQQVLPSLVTAVLVTWLFAPRPAVNRPRTIHRHWTGWAWRFLLSAATYLAAYWVFGSINFALVTRPFYEAQGAPLAVPAAQVTLQAELIRAVLIVLSVLPFLLAARLPLRRLALWSGLLLFLIGGIVPLTWQAGQLATPLLLASAVEIFLQNFTTGVAAALLLAAPTTAPADARPVPAT